MIKVTTLLGVALALSACAAQQSQNPGYAAPVQRSTDASLAGRTLQCSAQGPSESLTFGRDGRIAGRLLGTEAGGTWFALQGGAVEVHVDAGPVSVRDVLRKSGTRWSGRNISCG